MSAWETEILLEEVNADFLDELNDLDTDEVVEAIRDACVLAVGEGKVSEDERQNGLAAATIVAIWAGAPFTDADAVNEHPFIRANIGEGDEELYEVAASLLDTVETEHDLEAFTEALS
ncbi:DUF4259 domain-containing protein [Corynebacterium belfantii]|uniref:DUF4259 domain-containing protein n=1 Tax=Corynebacterium belfantii TaxID=2014537 RepID=UPI00095DC40F|nr:DUF4259 domain-containing protein [Corynebacterium belfantii]OLN16438.1 hypothetical protein BUE64_03130 [Corynebacterium diphtheriae subsp. lausannense]QVI97595.1 DUF4259 domain-containing protein [Corynebacterium diphtheriae]MBG9243669.1 DUF4259 domain-containing protein [Corynebacterium belfantii]MBG9258396.1 DUF4259 domain-containing protein [Corynebacterium belfantii]MBG9265059.1 DUF4259 domain-containing protein [Corynebacterium belfantii]